MVHEANKQHLSKDTEGTIVNKKTTVYSLQDSAVAVWGMNSECQQTEGAFSLKLA